ncbi:MAG: dimethyl sulfoxide reductase anchor subunit [Chloroflexi bacterium]|nr:dimethyl sulfoxide reductase anchor subunit [Chloroflexota bacterium]
MRRIIKQKLGHLNRPFLSYLSILNFKSSWLSREIVFSNLFFWMLSGSLYLTYFEAKRRILIALLGFLAMFIGGVMVYSMSQIYLLPGGMEFDFGHRRVLSNYAAAWGKNPGMSDGTGFEICRDPENRRRWLAGGPDLIFFGGLDYFDCGTGFHECRYYLYSNVSSEPGWFACPHQPDAAHGSLFFFIGDPPGFTGGRSSLPGICYL